MPKARFIGFHVGFFTKPNIFFKSSILIFSSS